MGCSNTLLLRVFVALYNLLDQERTTSFVKLGLSCWISRLCGCVCARVCMFVRVCGCVDTCECVDVCVCVHVCECSVSMCGCVCFCIGVCWHVFGGMHKHVQVVCACVCLYIWCCVCVCVCVCVYIYIYTYIYIYIYISLLSPEINSEGRVEIVGVDIVRTLNQLGREYSF